MKKFQTVVSVYGNGEYVINGVEIKEFSAYIRNTIKYGTGRALFIQGVCMYHGFLPPNDVEKWERKIQSNPDDFLAQEITKPYK